MKLLASTGDYKTGVLGSQGVQSSTLILGCIETWKTTFEIRKVIPNDNVNSLFNQLAQICDKDADIVGMMVQLLVKVKSKLIDASDHTCFVDMLRYWLDFWCVAPTARVPQMVSSSSSSSSLPFFASSMSLGSSSNAASSFSSSAPTAPVDFLFHKLAMEFSKKTNISLASTTANNATVTVRPQPRR